MEIFQSLSRTPVIPFRFGRTKPALAESRRLTFSWPLTAIGGSRPEKSDTESRNRMFVLGLGFVGGFFAQQLKEAGWVVSGTCTSASKKNEHEKRGIDVLLFNANEPESIILNTMKYHTHLLISIPPVFGIGDLHEELLRRELSGGNLQWLCYLSSTSVYGDCAGAWVSEDCPANPITESSKLRLAAEKGWLNLGHDLGISSQVFRLGGIYGPGRSAVDTLIKQEPLSEGQKWRASRKFTARIHVQDICQALKASIDTPSSGKIYNIVDDDPAPREEVFAYALDLIEKKWPGKIKKRVSLERAKVSEKESSSRGEKRVFNACMKKELGVRLLHPSYKSGVESIIEKMELL